jgi:hypothetical protein
MKHCRIIALLIFLTACQSTTEASGIPQAERPSRPIQLEPAIVAEVLAQPLEAGLVSPDIKQLELFTGLEASLPEDWWEPYHLYQDEAVMLEYAGYGDPLAIADRILQDMQANGLCAPDMGLAGVCTSQFDPISGRVLFNNGKDRTISVFDLAAQKWLAQRVPFEKRCDSYWDNRCSVEYMPFQAYDLSEPASPRLVYEHSFQRGAAYPASYQDHYYDGNLWGQGPIDIYDLSGDQGPQLVGAFGSLAEILEDNQVYSVGKFLIYGDIYTVAAPRSGRGQWFISRRGEFESVEDIADTLLYGNDFAIHNGVAYFPVRTVLLGAGMDNHGRVVIRYYYHPWSDNEWGLIESMGVLFGPEVDLQLP